jgi:hypothetical protein
MPASAGAASAGIGALRSLLDAHETTILRYVCQNGMQRSSVLLAAEVYGPHHAVGWLATEGILEGLAAFGLVAYRLGKNERSDPYHTIRATRRGYAVAGVDYHKPYEVGRYRRPRSTDMPTTHAGDFTDFRRHAERAMGSEVERMLLVEHCEVYYEHVGCHLDQLDEWWKRKEQGT